MIKVIRRSFVPAALNLYEVRKDKGPAGELWQKVQKQKPELYQGLFVVDGDGKVLAAHGKMVEPDRKWAEEVLDTFSAALARFGKVTPRDPAPRDPLPGRGLGLRRDGGITLAVYLRPMVLGLDPRGLGQLALDSVNLSEDDASRFSRENAKEGQTWVIPAAIVSRFHKVLSPTSDANNLAREDEVTEARLKGKVEAVVDGVAYMRFSGRIAGEHVWEFPPHKGKKIKAEATLEGVGAADAKTGRLSRLVLVARGVFRSYPPHDDPSGYGAVLDWRRRK